MFEQLVSWDHQLFLLINGSNSLFFDGFFLTITKTSTWIPFFACILYVIIKNNNMRGIISILLLIVVLITIADQGASSFCKPYFHRLRPCHNPNIFEYVDVVNNYRCGYYGFISSHASNTFSIALFLSLIFRYLPSTLYFFAFAILSCYSRIYLGVHYPGDISAGALYGLVCGVMFYYIHLYLKNKLSTDRKYFSRAYSSAGYLVSDLNIMGAGFCLTLIYILIRGVVYASVL